MDVGDEESTNMHVSKSGLRAEMSNKEKGTLKKNLLLCLVFEMFQTVESYVKESIETEKCFK